MAIARQSTIDRLIDREERLIEEAQRMLAIQEQQRVYHTSANWKNAITAARQRIRAIKSGLAPIRIAGRFFSLSALISEGQNIPPQIAQKAQEAETRFPGSHAQVYGWERDALPAERRRRDPVLALHYAGAIFFLGFWLEIATYDEGVPEFLGITVPWVEAKRGRPRKSASSSPLLLP